MISDCHLIAFGPLAEGLHPIQRDSAGVISDLNSSFLQVLSTLVRPACKLDCAEYHTWCYVLSCIAMYSIGESLLNVS